MPANATSGSSRQSRIQRYRRVMYACVVAGTLGFVVAARFEQVLVGLGVYWLGIIAFLGVWWGTDVELYDERDRTLEARAAKYSLLAVGVVFVVAMSVTTALEETSAFETPALFEGALLGYAGTMLVFAVACYWLRCHR